MKTNDARSLDHATLEAMRERAVRSVQEGESLEVVARVIGVNQKWFRNFAQDDKWNFRLTAGTLVPANQERP